MKTYTNKSNAARAAKGANGGTLTGLTLLGSEGAWYYGKPTDVGDNHTAAPVAKAATKKPAKPAKKATAAPAKKAAKAPAKKAGKRVAKAKPVKEVYDPKTGPKQGRISGYTIDSDRETKHGVKRRSSGTIGGGLWAIFDKMCNGTKKPADLEVAKVKESPLVKDYNKNKVVIEFYYWRRFHGVRSRGQKQKVG